MNSQKCLNWIFGRGLSIACGLEWEVPPPLKAAARKEQIPLIIKAIRAEMDRPYVDVTLINNFIDQLSDGTNAGYRHRFITTNWDYLLQRQLLALGMEELPSWLDESHVHHLNGSVEQLEDSSNRSEILIEEDPSSERCYSVEANVAFNKMLCDKLFIVVGMSFECDTDRFLLKRLGDIEDEMPIGESLWLVLNYDWDHMNDTCKRIKSALPRATVTGRRVDFKKWVEFGMYDMQSCGVLNKG